MNDPLPFPGSFAKISFRVETMLGNAGVNSIRTAVFTAPGDVAKLGERSVRNVEVVGSTPQKSKVLDYSECPDCLLN